VNRQVRLAEVGPEGQARLEAATAPVRHDGLAGLVEERYLRGAGVRTTREPGSLPLPFDVTDPAAESVARGAYGALVSIRKILGIQ
jgi:hypothetical protein